MGGKVGGWMGGRIQLNEPERHKNHQADRYSH